MDGMWLEALRLFLYGLVVLSLAGIAFVTGAFTAKKLENPPMVKIVDEVLDEPFGGAHNDAAESAAALRKSPFAGNQASRLRLGHRPRSKRSLQLLPPSAGGLA
jgi:hypothetical protein